jgi:PAS domain S-box-containing protein
MRDVYRIFISHLWENEWMATIPDYEALFRSSPYPYMLLDRDMTILAANDAYLAVTGAQARAIVGRALFEVFPENADDPESTNTAVVRSSVERAIATGKPDAASFIRYSMPREGEHGTVFEERYWSTVHTPVFDAQGEFLFVAQNSLDVTDFYRFDRRSGQVAPDAGPALDASQDPAGLARTHAAMRRAVLGERTYLKNLFDQAPGFMAVLAGPEHVFEMANEAYYQLVGHRAIIGKPVLEALPELRGQGYKELLDGVYETGKAFVGHGLPAQLQREPNGPVVQAHVDVLYQPLVGSDGKVSGIFVQGHDVSEAHAAQVAQRESEERLAEGLVAARMVVWDWDPATREVAMSHNAEQVFGLRGRTLEEYHARVHREDLERLEAAHERALAGCGSYAETVRYLRPDNGRMVWLEVRGRVCCDGAGRPVSVRGVALDVTERVRAEEDLRDAHRRKDEFLAMLAHELRNPLAPIASSAQLLRHGSLDATVRANAIDIISRQVRHLAGLLDDLIDVSRVTRGLVALDMRACDMHAVAADALEQIKPMTESRCQALTATLEEGPVRILGDHKRVVQVLANLLGNASKYTPAGGHIRLELAVRDDSVVLRIIDDGIGISAELLPRVFDLFTQGERSADRAQGGLGVGLAVVRSLVEVHGGQAYAASEGLGKGSVFTVVLPLLQAGDGSMPANAATQEPQARRPLRLLVVDDNPDAAMTLALLLQAQGHEVAVENGSLAALGRASRDRFDACLLDIGLPDMDGYELARRLRALPGMASCRLVAVTGYGQHGDRARAYEAGFDDHLVKPLDMDELDTLLRTLS